MWPRVFGSERRAWPTPLPGATGEATPSATRLPAPLGVRGRPQHRSFASYITYLGRTDQILQRGLRIATSRVFFVVSQFDFSRHRRGSSLTSESQQCGRCCGHRVARTGDRGRVLRRGTDPYSPSPGNRGFTVTRLSKYDVSAFWALFAFRCEGCSPLEPPQ